MSMERASEISKLPSVLHLPDPEVIVSPLLDEVRDEIHVGKVGIKFFGHDCDISWSTRPNIVIVPEHRVHREPMCIDDVCTRWMLANEENPADVILFCLKGPKNEILPRLWPEFEHDVGPATYDSSASSTPPFSPISSTAASCVLTPPTCEQHKRGERDMEVKVPNKRAKKTTLPFVTPLLVPVANFKDWQRHVNDFFALEDGVGVKKQQKMWALLKVWHSMLSRNVARFEVQGDVNVFGFTSVHVLDRVSWNEDMLALGKSLSRCPKNGTVDDIKEPRSCIYEMLMEYGGMQVVRSNGATARNKSLQQDSYMFNHSHFASTKENVNRQRTRKNN